MGRFSILGLLVLAGCTDKGCASFSCGAARQFSASGRKPGLHCRL